MATAGTLIVRMTARTEQFRKEMEESQKSLMKMTDAAAGMSAAIGVALAAAGAAAAAMALQVDDALDRIRVGTGETGVVLAGLQDSFRRVAGRAPGDLRRVSTAIADLNTRLGLTGPALETLTENVIHVNRMMGIETTALVRELGRVMGDWGIQTADASRTLDLMFAASQRTGIGIEQLGQRVVDYGAPLRMMGFRLEEAVALLSKFEREGVRTELVLGSLRIALGRFAQAGMAPAASLKIISEQIKHAADVATATRIAMEYFGARAGPDMASAIREGRLEIDSLVEILQRSEGVVKDTAKDVNGLAESWIVFRNQLLLAFGPLAPVLDAFSERIFPRLGAAVKQVGEIFELAFRPEMRMAVIGFAGAFAGLLVPAFLKAAGAAILFVKANMLVIKSLALFAVKGAAVALAAYVIYRAWADAGGGIMAVGVLMVRMVGAVVGVLGVLIPSLRAVSQSIYAYADSLAAASKATRTAVQPAAVGMGDLHTATAQVAKSGENAANAQESLGDATKSAAKAAGKSIMAFDQVHQLQEDMAGTGAAAAMAIALPEMAMPDVTMPGLQVPDVAAVVGPLDELARKWDAVTAAMERARPVLEGIGYIMAAILIPVFARYIGNLTLLAVTSTITAAKVVAAWVLKAAAAVASAATQVAAFVTLIGHWILLGVRATVEAAKVAAAWILQRVQALASLAAQLPAFAIIVAKWIWMAAVATARAAVMAAAWLIAMGPVGWVILAIGLVAAAVALNWDKVSTWTKEKWGAVSAYLVETWDKLKTWAGEKWEAIKTAIETPIRTVITWLETQWTAAGTWLGTQWDNIKIWAGEKWDGVKTAIETPIRTVITWLETQWNTISGTLGNIWEGIRTLAKDKWEGVRDIIRGVLNSIISLINRFIRFWNKIEIKVPLIVIPFVGTFGGWSVRVPQLPEIPQLAKGTNYVPQDMFAFLHRGEAVVPEKFNHPGNDSQDTDAIYQAVYAAVRDAIKVSRVEQGGQGQRQEVVLEIDGNKIGRAVLPSLIREGQRLGVQLAGV